MRTVHWTERCGRDSMRSNLECKGLTGSAKRSPPRTRGPLSHPSYQSLTGLQAPGPPACIPAALPLNFDLGGRQGRQKGVWGWVSVPPDDSCLRIPKASQSTHLRERCIQLPEPKQLYEVLPICSSRQCCGCTKERLHCCACTVRKHISKQEGGMWCSRVSEIRGVA